MQTLTKPWNKAPAGTEITDDPAEAKKGGKKVVLVDSARLAHLSKHGFFRVRKEAEDIKPEPSFLPAPRTIDPGPGLPNQGPASPRSDSGPKGDL